MLYYNDDMSECCNWVRLLSSHQAAVHVQHEAAVNDDGERVRWLLGAAEVDKLMKSMTEGKVAGVIAAPKLSTWRRTAVPSSLAEVERA
eukprot:1821125-Pyramimonas_sp.AAC.1